jgi:acyl-CoA thioesterase-1
MLSCGSNGHRLGILSKIIALKIMGDVSDFKVQAVIIRRFLFVAVPGITGAANAQVVALGASNVAGRGVGSAEAFPAQLEQMLSAKGLNVHVTNAGISGDTNEGMHGRVDSAVPEGTKVVILDMSGGTFNARRKNLGDQTAQLAAISARLRARG